MTPAAPLALDVLRFPLHGSQLIEASAGTGKTWTIAALVLRLVLGHGEGGSAFQRPLMPAEILVMTFTRAATRELSARIRSRLDEAARCFRGDVEAPAGDAVLQGLLQAHPPGPAREAAAWRLALAAEQMDEAAIHTIDAWCQRMLRDHAFDSGCLFDEELSADESSMRRDAARDVWRQQVYPLSGAALDAVLAVWPSAEHLAREAQQQLQREATLVPDPAMDPTPPGSLGAAAGAGTGIAADGASEGAADGAADDGVEGTRPRALQAAARDGQGAPGLASTVDALLARRARALAALKEGWPERAATLRAWLQAQLDPAIKAKDCRFDRSRLKLSICLPWLARLEAWALDAQDEDLGWSPPAVRRMSPAGMTEVFKGPGACALPPEFAALAALHAARRNLPSVADGLRPLAGALVGQRLAQIKQAAGRYGFSDMLRRLDAALDPARNGAAAERLRQRILQGTPVALVDEFQDTSPLQASIFDRLYRIAANDPATALLLIGDPKQSIYAFRGADIHSYLRTRDATAGRHHVLGTNHRSTTALVAAVNHLFAQAEATQPGGAFQFGAPGEAGSGGSLPFVPVAARGRLERCVTAAGPLPPLRLELDAQLQSADALRQACAARCAEHIVQLLDDPQAGFVIDDPAAAAAARRPVFQRLRPADIAVLVPTGREAEAVRRELRRRGVASVYLSDKDSVFASDEARDLWHWLRAVASPRDARLVRAALATATIGLGLDELRRLASDDDAFEQRCEQLRLLQGVWQQQGVLAMVRRSLHLLELPARWLAGDAGLPGSLQTQAGERRLTNVLHLAELLQAASSQLEGEQALVRWLGQQVQDSGTAADETVLRLESDADLVQVVTVHKSKGLEYPLVFLPFASLLRQDAMPARSGLADEDDDGGPPDAAAAEGTNADPGDGADPGAPGQAVAGDGGGVAGGDAALAGDALREALRLLYVALTRARHGLWVGLAALQVGRRPECTWPHSAIGRLLGGAEPVAPEQLAGRVQDIVQGCPGIRLGMATPLLELPCTRLQPRAAPTALAELPPYTAEFDRRWSVGSFSALLRGVQDGATAAALPPVLLDDEAPVPELPAAECSAAALPAAEAAADARARSSTGTDREAGDPPGPQHGVAQHGPGQEPWHAFPRGALPGNFLHQQLEWLADEGFDLDRNPLRQQQLLSRCDRQGWGHRSAEVLAWLRRVLATPLPVLRAPLQAVRGSLPEMEFWCPSSALQTQQLDAWCRRHLLPGVPRPPLPQRSLRGMLMGFADLVFEHGGRHWVLDHKSNHLGPDDASYGAQGLARAMAEHRYDVQAALYLLALHRLLGQRLGAAYDPAQHLGGALFVFLRGVASPSAGVQHLLPDAAALRTLDALLGEPETAP